MTRPATQARGDGPLRAELDEAVWLSGLVASRGDLEPGEALADRVFETVRVALEAAAVERDECDSVVIAADDVADGRSITTMLHATAAGAYRKDELRVTNGALTALGVAALRVAAGASRRSIVVAWWQPSAPAADLGRASLSVRDGSRPLVPPQRLGFEATAGACAACVVSPSGAGPGLRLEGFAFGQADYEAWAAADGEPAGVLSRVGGDLAGRCEPFGPDDFLCTSLVDEPDRWDVAAGAVGMGDADRLRPPAAHHGLADGLVVLSRLAAALPHGGRGVALATGVPPFLVAEAAAVRREDA